MECLKCIYSSMVNKRSQLFLILIFSEFLIAYYYWLYYNSNDGVTVKLIRNSSYREMYQVSHDLSQREITKPREIIVTQNDNSVQLSLHNFSSPFVLLNKTNSAIKAKADHRDDQSREWSGRRQRFISTGHEDLRVRSRTVAVVRTCLNSSSRDCLEPMRISFKGCGYSRCLPVSDWQGADVIVFAMPYLVRNITLPKFRRPDNQRWVMFSVEPPSRAPTSFILNTSQFQGQFNWSMTYNLDSDIPLLYGQLKVISRPSDVDYDAIYTTKTALAAWFVSHCHTSSLREVYVTSMQKVIDVHIFGTCGTYNCSSDLNRHRDDKSICLPLLTSRYFFYLAFENSICEDYVTEKFFKLFPVAKVVPVVLGGIEYKRYFPPDTFIDASDFDSPEDLAHHLKELAQDKYRYLKILRTQSKYKHYQESWKCKLCEKMTNDHSVQWYPGNNMWSWFVHDRCRNPQKKMKFDFFSKKKKKYFEQTL